MNRLLAQKLYPEMPFQRSIKGGSFRRWLETFVAMTEPGQPGCLITHLDIHELFKADSEQWKVIGNVDGEHDDDFGVDESAEPQSVLLDLLCPRIPQSIPKLRRKTSQPKACRSSKQTFRRLVLLCCSCSASRYSVVSITLPLDVDEKWDWLENKDVFILGCNRLTILEAFDLSASFEDLLLLSLHVASTEDCAQWQDEWDHSKKPHDLDTSYYGAILTLLEICPALCGLHLYGYNAWGAAKVGLLDEIVARCPDLPLEDVTLHGFGTADGELSRILRHFSDRLRRVEIAAFMLTKEEMENLFRNVVEELPWIEEVSFDNLEVVGPKNSALLHSPKYIDRRSRSKNEFGYTVYHKPRIDLVCSERTVAPLEMVIVCMPSSDPKDIYLMGTMRRPK